MINNWHRKFQLVCGNFESWSYELITYIFINNEVCTYDNIINDENMKWCLDYFRLQNNFHDIIKNIIRTLADFTYTKIIESFTTWNDVIGIRLTFRSSEDSNLLGNYFPDQVPLLEKSNSVYIHHNRYSKRLFSVFAYVSI